MTIQLTFGERTPLEEDMTDILSLVVWAVVNSPACWDHAESKRRGFPHSAHHLCPDHATFDFWVERPGTGWYDMCQEAGTPGYDGVHPAWAIELDQTWLSWDQSSDSLLARLQKP